MSYDPLANFYYLKRMTTVCLGSGMVLNPYVDKTGPSYCAHCRQMQSTQLVKSPEGKLRRIMLAHYPPEQGPVLADSEWIASE